MQVKHRRVPTATASLQPPAPASASFPYLTLINHLPLPRIFLPGLFKDAFSDALVILQQKGKAQNLLFPADTLLLNLLLTVPRLLEKQADT